MLYLNKIISATQTREADQFTIENEPIASIDLMERASNAFVEAIEPDLDPKQKIAVLCGPGNKGGDGLAIARILMWKGYEVTPYLCMISDKISQDCDINRNKIDNIQVIAAYDLMPQFDDYDVLIDGLFGSGLSRRIEGWAAEIVDELNFSDATVYSIDIPSGMYCDEVPEGDHIVVADAVVSFQRPKLSFFLPESSQYIKAWKVVDIGLDEHFLHSVPSENFLLDESIRTSISPREKYSHKGTYGHALIIAGARGKMGAAVLCGSSCLRSGAGLLTMHVPLCGLDIVQTTLPEAMCSLDLHNFHFSSHLVLDSFKCIGVGPGIGTSKETKEALMHLLNTTNIPMVMDADALNILSSDQSLLTLLPQEAVLTPHPKEFERLVGTWTNSLERLEKQKHFSMQHQCIIVLKDADTVITDPEGNAYFNTTGNPGMATGGSGDVLTGIITGLIAQEYTPLEAALIGVYFHGLSGDVAVRQKGQNALLASDIVNYLRIE
ncbi:MAG: NAD(P)H-hydrate dehydratase [Bacteroidota bacterium]